MNAFNIFSAYSIASLLLKAIQSHPSISHYHFDYWLIPFIQAIEYYLNHYWLLF